MQIKCNTLIPTSTYIKNFFQTMDSNNYKTLKMCSIMHPKKISGSDVNILLCSSQKNGLCHLPFFRVSSIFSSLTFVIRSFPTFNFSSLQLVLGIESLSCIDQKCECRRIQELYLLTSHSPSTKLNILITKINCICFNMRPLNYSWHSKLSEIGG